MTDPKKSPSMPARVADIIACGFATWATDGVDEALRARFDARADSRCRRTQRPRLGPAG